MKKWEYRIEFVAYFDENPVMDKEDPNYGRSKWQVQIEEQLNKLGEDGWELFSTLDEILGDKSCCGYALFKRPKGN